MALERVGHTRVKSSAWLALRNAIEAAGVAAKAYPDGLAVEAGDASLYKPDVLVNGGEIADRDAMIAPNPIVAVKVVTPASRGVDTSWKLVDYFSVFSIRHFLIMATERRVVVHHTRRGDGWIETRIAASGRIEMDPFGITVNVEEISAE